MEGVGSRQSRASSRYASGPSPPVFSGRVRKWKKQWVSSPAASFSKGGKRNEAPPLLLCRWTPLSAAEEPPKRRFRYTPIVPIEKGKTKSVEDEVESGSAMLEKTISRDESAQEMNEDQADSNKTQDPLAL